MPAEFLSGVAGKVFLHCLFFHGVKAIPNRLMRIQVCLDTLGGSWIEARQTRQVIAARNFQKHPLGIFVCKKLQVHSFKILGAYSLPREPAYCFLLVVRGGILAGSSRGIEDSPRLSVKNIRRKISAIGNRRIGAEKRHEIKIETTQGVRGLAKVCVSVPRNSRLRRKISVFLEYAHRARDISRVAELSRGKRLLDFCGCHTHPADTRFCVHHLLAARTGNLL